MSEGEGALLQAKHLPHPTLQLLSHINWLLLNKSAAAEFLAKVSNGWCGWCAGLAVFFKGVSIIVVFITGGGRVV